MLRPRYLTSSTCGLKRLPSHWSHGTNTSARNCISTRTSPSPWQASQRPPGTLNEKWLAVSPRERASFVAANSSLIGSKALRYVTGLDRGVQHVVDKRGLSRSAHAGHNSQRVQRNADVDVFQVMLGGAQQLQFLSG